MKKPESVKGATVGSLRPGFGRPSGHKGRGSGAGSFKGMLLLWTFDLHGFELGLKGRWRYAEKLRSAFFTGDAPLGGLQGKQDVVAFQPLELLHGF